MKTVTDYVKHELKVLYSAIKLTQKDTFRNEFC